MFSSVLINNLILSQSSSFESCHWICIIYDLFFEFELSWKGILQKSWRFSTTARYKQINYYCNHNIKIMMFHSIQPHLGPHFWGLRPRRHVFRIPEIRDMWRVGMWMWHDWWLMIHSMIRHVLIRGCFCGYDGKKNIVVWNSPPLWWGSHIYANRDSCHHRFDHSENKLLMGMVGAEAKSSSVP